MRFGNFLHYPYMKVLKTSKYVFVLEFKDFIGRPVLS